MNPNEKSKTGWVVAGVLAIVVVVLIAMLWHDWNERQHDLGAVLQEGKENVMDARADVQTKCRGPQANEKACQDALDDLAGILREFSKDVNTASTSGAQ